MGLSHDLQQKMGFVNADVGLALGMVNDPEPELGHSQFRIVSGHNFGLPDHNQ